MGPSGNAEDAQLDVLPKRSKVPVIVALGAVVLAAATYAVVHRPPKPEAPERLVFRKLLPAWEIYQSREPERAPDAMKEMVTAAKPWPNVVTALEALPAAWSSQDRLVLATRALNGAARDAGLDYWVDPQFPGPTSVLATYDVLGRAQWAASDATTEVLHVRRLDTLNLEMGLLGHASGDQPAVLRDRIEMNVVEKLTTLGDEEQAENTVDAAAAKLWRAQMGTLIGSAGLDEAERRINEREKLAHAMEHRLRSGSVHIAHPERLVFGSAYFDTLEPYTSTRLRGGPVLLASDLRALRRADEALDGSDGLKAIVGIVDREAESVEAHEAHHALDMKDREPPELLQTLVGKGDVDFAKLAEHELRAYLGELHDASTPACLAIVNLGKQARGRYAEATPHFFAAQTILTVLGDIPGKRGVDEDQVISLMQSLCALPDAELRERGAAAATTLYGAPLHVAKRTAYVSAGPGSR